MYLPIISNSHDSWGIIQWLSLYIYIQYYMYIHMKMVDIYKQLNISMLSCCNGFYNDWDIRKNELVGNIN
jgi:hypothetical protein